MNTANNILRILSLLLITVFSVGCSNCRLLLSSTFSSPAPEASQVSEIQLDTLMLEGCYHVTLRGNEDAYMLSGRVASEADNETIESAVRKRYPTIKIFNDLNVDDSLILGSRQSLSALYEAPVPLTQVQRQIAEVISRAVPRGSGVNFELSVARTLKISGDLPSRRVADRLLYEAETVHGVHSVESELTVNGAAYYPDEQEFNLGLACAAAGLPTYQMWYASLY